MDIVALLEVLVKEIIAAEEKFLKNPKDFYSLETSVKASTENFSAGFLSAVLSSMNERPVSYTHLYWMFRILCGSKPGMPMWKALARSQFVS